MKLIHPIRPRRFPRESRRNFLAGGQFGGLSAFFQCFRWFQRSEPVPGLPASCSDPRCARVSGCGGCCRFLPGSIAAERPTGAEVSRLGSRTTAAGSFPGTAHEKTRNRQPVFFLVSCSALFAGFWLSIGGGLNVANLRGVVFRVAGSEPSREDYRPRVVSSAGCGEW